jgi:hypothetical protein
MNRSGRRTGLLVVAGILAASVSMQAADQELYFAKSPDFATPLGTAPLVFGVKDFIDFQLVLRTKSVEDRSRFPDLIIDDSLIDLRSQSAVHPAPNVRVEVLEVLRGGVTRPASYLVSGSGDSVDVQYLEADVWFLLGRYQMTYRLMYGLWYVGALLLDYHAPGTYRIRAFYREFVTPPVLVIVK